MNVSHFVRRPATVRVYQVRPGWIYCDACLPAWRACVRACSSQPAVASSSTNSPETDRAKQQRCLQAGLKFFNRVNDSGSAHSTVIITNRRVVRLGWIQNPIQILHHTIDVVNTLTCAHQ